jgi:hypothetical protein
MARGASGVFLLYLLISCLLNYRVFTGGMLIAPENDALAQNYPIKHLYSYALGNLEFPLWNPYQFAGIPFLGEIQNGALYPLNLLLYFFIDAPYAFNLSYMLHLALGGFFTFLYLELLGIRRFPAFLAGLVFAFSGFLFGSRDHTAIRDSAAYLPLIIYFLERLRRTPSWRHTLPLGLAAGVQVLAGSPQVCLYTYMVVGAFLMFHALKGRHEAGGRFFLLGVMGMLLGMIIASPQLLSTMELSSMSWREGRRLYLGFQHFSEYHLYRETLATVFMPGVFGEMGPTDSTEVRMGVFPPVLALAALLMLGRRNRQVQFWGAVGLMGILLALGSDTPLEGLLYHLPVYNAFRVHGRNLLELSFAVSVLSGILLDGVLYEMKREQLRGIVIALLSAGALSAAAVMFFRAPPLEGYLLGRGFRNLHLMDETLSLSNSAVYISLGIIALYVLWAAAYAFCSIRGRGAAAARSLLAVILLMEVFVMGDFRNLSGPQLSLAGDMCAKEEVYGLAGGDKDMARVLNAIPRELWYETDKYNPLANVTCRTSSATGYDPLMLERYGELMRLGVWGLGSLSLDFLLRNNVIISMQGAKYIRVPKGKGLPPKGVRRVGSPPERKGLGTLRWTPSAGAGREGDTYRLHSPKGGFSLLMGRLDLQRGAYAVSFRAGGKVTGFMGLYLYPEAELGGIEAFDDHDSELLIPADWLSGQYREFHQVVYIEEDGPHALILVTLPLGNVEVSDFTLERFSRYSPPYLSRAGVEDEAEPVYEKLYDDGPYGIYLNRNALPRAWSVSRLVWVSGFGEVMKKLDYLEVNPAGEAMLSGSDIVRLGKRSFTPGEVSIEDYGMNSVSLGTRFTGEGFLVLSDQYYPGWRAYVDGQETEVYEVNGIQRGIVVPPGEHKVLFLYRPQGVLALMALSLALACGCALTLMRKP